MSLRQPCVTNLYNTTNYDHSNQILFLYRWIHIMYKYSPATLAYYWTIWLASSNSPSMKSKTTLYGYLQKITELKYPYNVHQSRHFMSHFTKKKRKKLVTSGSSGKRLSLQAQFDVQVWSYVWNDCMKMKLMQIFQVINKVYLIGFSQRCG